MKKTAHFEHKATTELTAVLGRWTHWLCATIATVGLAFVATTHAPRNALAQAVTAQTIFDAHAYSGKFSSGVREAEALLQRAPTDGNAIAALGILQTLDAFARMQTAFAERAQLADMSELTRGGLIGLFLGSRLGLGRSTDPAAGAGAATEPSAPMTYEVLRQITARFISDLTRAEATLEKLGGAPAKLTIKPMQIAFDFNADGRTEPTESLFMAIATMGRSTRRMAMRAQGLRDLELGFDTTDVSWLRGYANVFLALAKLTQSLDTRDTFETLAHYVYGPSATAMGRLDKAEAKLITPNPADQARLREIAVELAAIPSRSDVRDELRDIRDQLRTMPRSGPGSEGRGDLQTRQVELMATRRDLRRKRSKLQREQRRLREKLSGSGRVQMAFIMDMVAGLRAIDWRVENRRLLDEARRHLIAVADINQQTWRLAAIETDDDREWLPNPRQTPPLDAPRIEQSAIDAWARTLATAKDVLEGRALVHHPRFTRGVNVKRLLDEAPRIDAILIATGHAIVPYLEAGKPKVDTDTLSRIMAPMGPNAAAFAVWFN